MPEFSSIAAVGRSITRLLDVAFQVRPPVADAARAILVQTENLDRKVTNTLNPPCVSVLLYRVDFNKVLRAAASANDQRARQRLPLDLHFLLTAWGETAEDEHLLIGRTLQALDASSVLRGPMLDPMGGWGELDSIEVVLEDLTTEDLMQTFYSLKCDFRLSLPYLARVVMIDGDERDGDVAVRTAIAGVRPLSEALR